MATRKSRQNTESPTPSLNENTPLTPTTPATRNTRSIRNKQLQQSKTEDIQIKSEKIDEDEEAVKEATTDCDTANSGSNVTIDRDDVKDIEKPDKEKEKEKGSTPPAASTRKRRLAAAIKDEPKDLGEKLASSSESICPATPNDEKAASSNKLKRSRRSAFELPIGDESSPCIVATRRNSTGRIERPTRKLSSRIKKLKQLRKTSLKGTLMKKPAKLSTAVNKPLKQLIEKQVAKVAKADKNDSASDSELMKMSRRRSDSVSKSSDMTDASSFQETKDSHEDLSLTHPVEPQTLTIKREALEKEEATGKLSAEIEQNESVSSNAAAALATGSNDSGIGGDSDNSRSSDNKGGRSLRRKKPLNLPTKIINTRSRCETPNKPPTDSQENDESEVIELKNDIKKEKIDTPLHIETTTNETIADEQSPTDIEAATDKNSETVTEKEKSMSPALVSEGVSEISVKQFYGHADFLENNLGIEKDPKLGEIVQEQEKMKADRVDSDTNKIIDEIETVVESEPMEGVKDDLNASTESVDMENAVAADDEEIETKLGSECTIEPAGKKDSQIFNEKLLVLNGEIEFRKKEKKEMAKKIEEDVGEVVLYTISNGVRVNPEKLKKVLESQKFKDIEKSDSEESTAGKEPNGVHEEISEEGEHEDDEEEEEEEEEEIEEAKEDDQNNELEPEDKSDNVQSKEGKSETTVDTDAVTKPAPVSNSTGSNRSSIDDESPEEKEQKESHLKTLGLLTHQAAVEATIEKQKQREKCKASITSSSHGSKGKKGSDYTGTLKTVIKVCRGNNNDKKKTNSALKLTLHKGRAKNGHSDRGDSAANSDEDTYYTIQQQDMEVVDAETLLAEEAAAKEHEKLLVIPEKASSFRYHPEKLCEDQCFYCGGKFGLFDTPCHIAQIKSAERQKKILDYEEKLTVDSCLCDACFRHVDRRANCSSYKKRLSEPAKTHDSNEDNEEKSDDAPIFRNNKELSWCQVVDCNEQASHSVCRKWANKIRKTLNKTLQFNNDNMNSSTTLLSICDKHYDDINYLLVCILCNRRLKRNQCHFVAQDTSKVESLLSAEGIPGTVGTTSVACKLCRYYINLLSKPQENKKAEFVRDYRKRLLEFHKFDAADDDSEDSGNQGPAAKRPKRNRRSLPEYGSRPADTPMEQESRETRARQKNKQNAQQQLLAEQQRVEQRVQQEQMKLKQQELMQQKQQHKDQEEKRQQKLRASSEDISNLRTNPNISMRELFPGEEDLGLHVNLPFVSKNDSGAYGSTRTPDGWTKVTSTVQYDEPTRRLWEELQKPYGNQSSFLRHLLLLEKYFRNGDLLLSQNANPNAIVYAESVQHRLQAYDNIPPRPISVTQVAAPNSVTTANKAITISKVNTPAQPKSTNPSVTVTSKSNSSESSNSLLKANMAQMARSRNYTVTTEPINGDKSTVVSNNTDLIKLNNATIQQGKTSTPKNKSIGLPPELICINSSTPNEKTTDKQPSVPLSYQLQMQLTLAQQIQQQHQNSLLLPQQTKQMIQNLATPSTQHANKTNQIISPKKQSTGNAATTTHKSPPNKANTNVSGNKSNVIRLPDSLTEAEQLESKNWRPTLMPITAENNKINTDIYLTADGRKLPYLVQVQSGGKPYMISIFDYNRMCILRRERLLSDRPELMKNKSTQGPNQSNAPRQSAAAHTANSTQKTSNVIDAEKLNKSQTQKTNNGPPIPKVQIPNQVLAQNSLFPITNKPNENVSASDSLLKRNKANQSSLLKSNALHQQQTHKTQQVQPKLPLSLTNPSQSNVVSITSTPSISAILAMNHNAPAPTPPPIQLIPNAQPITITNVTTSGSTSATSQANVSALEALFKTTNQVTTNPSVMLQWAEQLNKCSNLSNNSFGSTNNDTATSILSKIPKSLTVIPQAKRPSNE